MSIIFLCIFLALVGYLGYIRASLNAITISLAVYLVFLTILGSPGLGTFILWLIYAAVFIPLNVEVIRLPYITRPLFEYARKLLPTLSETEAQALESGTVNWDGELFSGRPNWDLFLKSSAPKIKKEEKEFIDNQVEELCKNLDNWEITHTLFNIPKKIIDYIGKHKFMGFIIPKKYGGLEMTACAQSEVLIKVGSRSPDTALALIGVPNSIGPGELIEKYGTKEQKEHYLPRLADGREIPCFALTGPFAGSDASGMPDNGIIEEAEIKGKKVLGIRLTFKKRYITLAPISTLIALSFKLFDPNNLIGDRNEYGITVALVPTNLDGIQIGRRHLPLHQAFPNGPIEGKDVFIPLDSIIGGKEMAGQGWRMLMECLAVGRAISIPTGGVTTCKVATYTSALYSKIRTQFRIPIGNFEGVKEKLAELAGYTLMADATLKFTLAAVDRGEKPAVPSAISKYHLTQLSRACIINAMDIHGGKGIIMGPNNYLARMYEGNPVPVTVEGANVLTRNMIIFGQGGVRCHPYILKEIRAIEANDLTEFDRHLLSHAGFIISNAIRSFLLAITSGKLQIMPTQVAKTTQHYQRLTRLSSSFAFVADVTMSLLGGKLKFKESLSARLGDTLSMLYMGSAILKKYEDDGQPNYMLPTVSWAMQHVTFEAQAALDGVLRNYPQRWIGLLLRFLVFPLGLRYKQPNDKLRHQVADDLLNSEEIRQYLAQGIYMTDSGDNVYAKLKKTAALADATRVLEQKVHEAKRQGKIGGHYFDDVIGQAKAAKIITAAEEKKLLATYEAVLEIINVDDFDPKELATKVG